MALQRLNDEQFAAILERANEEYDSSLHFKDFHSFEWTKADRDVRDLGASNIVVTKAKRDELIKKRNNAKKGLDKAEVAYTQAALTKGWIETVQRDRRIRKTLTASSSHSSSRPG